MFKPEPAPSQQYAEEIRLFNKQFKTLERKDVRLVLDFCEFDIVKSWKILSLIAQDKHSSFLKSLVDRPEDSDKLINNML